MSTYAEKLEQLQRMRAEVRRLERVAEAEARAMRPLTEADERAMSDMQVRADSAYMAANRRAPPPHAYERPDEYRRRLADGVKGYSLRWSKADLGLLPDDALNVAETQIYADAAIHGRTHGLRADEIRERVTESGGGHKVVEFDGGPGAHFVQQFRREPRRAVLKSMEHYAAMSRDTNLARINEIIRHRPIPQPMRPHAGF